MPIEDIEVGDYVWAENPETGEIELKEVLNTFEKQVDTIVTITIDGEKIQTTEAHLFYVEDTGWIPASMLKEGDVLSIEDGREVPVQSIKIVNYNYYIPVYNFEVKDFHTYYVSDDSVLVHNNCQYKPPKGGGVTTRVIVGNIEVQFGHGGRHLNGTNIDMNDLEKFLANEVVKKHPGTGKFKKFTTFYKKQKIEYTSYGVEDEVIKIGTYYIVES